MSERIIKDGELCQYSVLSRVDNACGHGKYCNYEQCDLIRGVFIDAETARLAAELLTQNEYGEEIGNQILAALMPAE